MTAARSGALERELPEREVRGPVTRPMAAAPPPPSRHHRRAARRRLVREQVVVVLVLLALLSATVVLLSFEWLSSGPVSSNSPPLLHLFGGS